MFAWQGARAHACVCGGGGRVGGGGGGGEEIENATLNEGRTKYIAFSD